MNDAQLLERLTNAYATLDTPTPSAALTAVLEAGGVDAVEDDERRVAVVVPLVRPRPRMRMRYLAAAMVASFVALSGLAVAGALPGPLQRGVSSVVSHLGIDLPSPGADHGGGTPGQEHAPGGRQEPASSTTAPNAGTVGGSSGAGGAAGSSPLPTAPAGSLPLGDLGSVTGAEPPVTTPPPGGSDAVPPVTLPQITLPSVTLPPITLPSVTVPTITVPPVTLPQLPLTLPLGVPLLGS